MNLTFRLTLHGVEGGATLEVENPWRPRHPVLAHLPPAVSARILCPLSDQTYAGPLTVLARATGAQAMSYRVDDGGEVAMTYNAVAGCWQAPAPLLPPPAPGRCHVTVTARDGDLAAEDRAWNVTLLPADAPAPDPAPDPDPETPPPDPGPEPAPPGAPTGEGPPASGAGKRWGVNLAGAEFGEHALPGTLDQDYTYPADPTALAAFAARGLRLLRLPLRWERVQRAPSGPLHAPDVARIRAVLDAAQDIGQQVILDLHNYGRYHGRPLTRGDAALLADVWRRLAGEFAGHPACYGYELMNEPHDLPGDGATWAHLAQAATDAIRQVDGEGWVLVPGYSWQSARFWRDNNEALAIQDPAGRLLYAAHCYFDANHTGTYQAGYDAGSVDVGVERVQPFLAWLDAHGHRGILTEYGVPANPGDDARWLEVLSRFLEVLDAHPRIVGGTYWAAGPWWGGYPLSVEPGPGGQERPQMAVLARVAARAAQGAQAAQGAAPTPAG